MYLLSVYSVLGFLSAAAAANYELIKEYMFTDEATLRSEWDVEVRPAGWVNNEYQAYIDDGSTFWVADGLLYIKAYRKNGKYYSGRLKSKQKYTPATQPGHKLRVEFVAKVPTNSGGWPALWMLGNKTTYGAWPRCGEIDLMEWAHQSDNATSAALHWKGSTDWNTKFTRSRSEIANNFNTYGVEYSNSAKDEYIQFYNVGVKNDKLNGPRVNSTKWLYNNFPPCNYTYSLEATYCSFAAPFDNPHELIMNVAVGGQKGNCCGVQTSDYDVFDQGIIMQVQSVKVFGATSK